jgi:carbonic anhydrase
MEFASPLPDFMIDRHRAWRETLAREDRDTLARLAEEGQSPRAMIIACCDSRLMATELFGSAAGEFFVHRNIANLVPRFDAPGGQRGTSATIEFAVETLKVGHIVVLGHYGCGGVKECLAQATGRAPDHGSDTSSFVTRWLEILAPQVPGILARHLDRDATLRALEHETILLSLGNLMTFPFVRDAVLSGTLQLHGTWNDIREAVLEVYDPATAAFHKL